MLSNYIQDNTKGVGSVLGARIFNSINDFVETIVVVDEPLQIEDETLQIENVVEETPLERVERRRNEFKLLKEKVKFKSNYERICNIGLTNRVLTTEEINEILIKRGII